MSVFLQPKHLVASRICVMGRQSDAVNEVPDMLSDQKGIRAFVEMMVMEVPDRAEKRPISLKS